MHPPPLSVPPARVSSTAVDAGEPVLALHASMSSKSQWRELAAELGSRHPVIAVDLHGYGNRPLPARAAFGLGAEVDLVVDAATEALGSLKPLHVVGHSYGAAVALALARMHPGLVRSLSLYEPVCFNLLDPEGPHHPVVVRFARSVEDLVRRGHHAEAARRFVEYWGGPHAYTGQREEARARLDRLVRKVPLDFAALLSAPRAPAWYGRIRVPTLLMMGRASHESVRMIAKTLWASLGAALLMELPGDHLHPLHQPRVLAAEASRFIIAVARELPRPGRELRR